MPTPLLENRQLGPDVQRGNLLVNGGFEIWQRGSGPFTTAQNTADRWALNLGGETASVQREGSIVAPGSAASLRWTYTRSTGAAWIGQSLNEFASVLAGKTISFSIMVNAPVGVGINVFIQDSSGSSVTQVTGNGAWQSVSHTRTIPAGVTMLQTPIYALASGTIYLDNAMLVVGSQPANYVPLHPADDLARCLRYYYNHQLRAGSFLLGGAKDAASVYTHASYQIRWPVLMAGTPTVTGSFAVNTGNAGTPLAYVIDTYGAGYQNGANNWTTAANVSLTGLTAEFNP